MVTQRESNHQGSKKNQELDDILAQTICLCKNINLKGILTKLPGSESLEDINLKTGSGSGSCKGRRCRDKLQSLVNLEKKRT